MPCHLFLIYLKKASIFVGMKISNKGKILKQVKITDFFNGILIQGYKYEMILFQLPPIFFLKSVFLLGGKNFILSLKCQSYLALIFNSEIGEGSLGQTFSVSNILNLVAAAELCCGFFWTKFVSCPYCCPNLLFVCHKNHVLVFQHSLLV